MAGSKPKRFADLIVPFGGDFEVRKIDSLLGKEIVVLDVEEREGQWGPFLYVKAKDEGKNDIFVFRTGSVVLMKYLKLAKEKGYLPLAGVIEKTEDYYTIS